MLVPGKIGSVEQFEDAADSGALGARQADLDALPQGKAPDCRDLVSKVGDDGGRGVEAAVEPETDLVLRHAEEEAVGVAQGWPVAIATGCEKGRVRKFVCGSLK